MKHGLMSWLTCALLLSMATRASANDSPQTSLDQAQWNRLITSIKDSPVETLLNSRLPAPALIKQERFAAAGAECFANAVALLNINDQLHDQPRSIRMGEKPVWNGKTAMFVLRSYAGDREFLFLCLVDKDGRLERTRLLRPGLPDKKSAIEIDNAKYIYSGK